MSKMDAKKSELEKAHEFSALIIGFVGRVQFEG